MIEIYKELFYKLGIEFADLIVPIIGLVFVFSLMAYIIHDKSR